jgi:proline dehydrogenase
MLQALSKATFATLATSTVLKKVASRYGMRRPTSFARRFVAGHSIEEAIACARRIEAAGMTVTLDHLGERVTSRDLATAATRAYTEIVRAATDAGISRNLSVKLSQLGLDIDRATAIDNFRRVLSAAGDGDDFFIRIDMESSVYTDETFEVFDAIWSLGHRNVGVVIQSCLYRSPEDVRRMNALGARVRLVKGAYRESRDVAFSVKEDVDRAFVELMQSLLRDGTYPAIATHDPVILQATREFAASRSLDRNAYEFQMLFGIRRDLQRELTGQGHQLRVYVPFGTEWFPYFMRRLGERPANVTFVMKSVMREKL